MISKRGNGIRWMATNKVLVVLLSVLWGVMPCERYGYCLGESSKVVVSLFLYFDANQYSVTFFVIRKVKQLY